VEEEKKFSGQREQGGPYVSRGKPEFAPDANRFARDAKCLFKQLRFSSFASFFKFYILGSEGAWCSARTAGTWMALLGAILVQCADGGNLDGVARGDLGAVNMPVSDELLASLKEASIKGGRFPSVPDA
jgi:hypothetical protein